MSAQAPAEPLSGAGAGAGLWKERKLVEPLLAGGSKEMVSKGAGLGAGNPYPPASVPFKKCSLMHSLKQINNGALETVANPSLALTGYAWRVHSGAWKWDSNLVSPTPLPFLGSSHRKSDPRALRSRQRSGLCSDSPVPLPFPL